MFHTTSTDKKETKKCLRSKVDNRKDFNEKKWVVSLINTKIGFEGLIGGHAKIVVEGLKRDSNDLFPKLFVAEYHIMEANRIPEHTWIPQALRNTQCNYLVLIKEPKEGFDLSLMSVTSFDQLDTSKLEKKPYFIKDAEDKYRIWGYKENKWQLTDIDISNLEIPFTWEIDQTVFVSPKDAIFDTLKKGHTPEEESYNERQERQYSEVNCKSWWASSDAVKRMIENIKKERNDIDMGEKEPIFEYFGKWSFLGSNGGHNCTTWAEEKLAIAKIGNGVKLSDSLKAAPSSHTSSFSFLF